MLYLPTQTRFPIEEEGVTCRGSNSLRSKRFCAVREQRITGRLFLLSPHFSHGQIAENPVLRSLLHGNALLHRLRVKTN